MRTTSARLPWASIPLLFSLVCVGCGGGDDHPAQTVIAQTVKDGVKCTAMLVPARDGTQLYTEVYVRDAAGESRYPTIVTRSPYGALFGEGCFSGQGMQAWVQAGYAGVYQSVRGTKSSGGTFTPFFQERSDGSDIIDWVGKQAWSNGKIGMVGTSYMGVSDWQAAATTPASLTALATHVTGADYHEDWVGRSGVFDLQFAQVWAESFVPDQIGRAMRAQGASDAQVDAAVSAFEGDKTTNGAWLGVLPLSGTWSATTRDRVPFFWEWLKHPTYDDYWAQVDVTRTYPKVTVPALVSGGWYDFFTNGTIDNFVGMKASGGSEVARRGTMLVMDCCGHGLFNPVNPGITWGENKTNLDALRMKFLQKYVASSGSAIDDEPAVQLTVLVPPDVGLAGDNFVFKTSTFPVPGTVSKRYSLVSGGHANTAQGDGVLDDSLPPSGPPDSFTYDPLNPVPTVGGNSSNLALDQRVVETRPDVLVYTGRLQDVPMAMIGKVTVEFWAQTDGLDTDFTAKLVDVHPDGYAHNIVDRIVRGRYRKGSKLPPELLTPNAAYAYTLDLGYTATMLKPGHRLRLEISSSNFPHYQRNLNTGGSNEDGSTTRIAGNTVLHDATHPSTLIIPVVPEVSAAWR